MMTVRTFCLSALLLPGAGFAGEPAGSKIDYKLTAAYYAAQDGNDLNVRAALSNGNVWAGH